MKVKLCVSRERYQEIKDALLDHGIEIDDHADLIISERSCFEDHLMVKNLKTNERMVLSTCEIISIESFGHFIEVYTQNEVYQAVDRLYRIEGQMDPARFLRISHSVIIARDLRRYQNEFSILFCYGPGGDCNHYGCVSDLLPAL